MHQNTVRILNKHFGVNAIKTINEKDCIFRCQKDFHDVPYQILYVDCSQTWMSEKFDLKALETYQEKNLLQDYYRQSGSLQWNFYYAFIANEDQIQKNILRKNEIEKDELYSRKIVLTNDELDQWLTKIDNIGKPSEAFLDKDLSSIWINKLKDAKLDAIFLGETYAAGVKKYLDGEPILIAEEKEEHGNNDFDKKGKITFIKSLEVIRYRMQPQKKYEFGKVNLIKGINGSGKTSLLEAIELILCGKTFRNPNVDTSNIVLKVLFDGNSDVEEFAPKNIKLYKERDRNWYNNADQKTNRLYISFNKYNFFNTDAAHLLANDSDKSNVKKAFEDIALGEDVNRIEVRLKGFRDRFYSSLNFYNKLFNEFNTELKKEKELLKELGDIDKNPEHYLKEVISEANRINWRINIKEKDKFIPLLEKRIVTVNFYLESIKGKLVWKSNISYNSVIKTLRGFLQVKRDIDALKLQIKKQDDELIVIKQRLDKLKIINEILEQLIPFYKEPKLKELIGISKKLRTGKIELEKLEKLKQLYNEIDFEEVRDVPAEMKLNQYSHFLNKQIKTEEIAVKILLKKRVRLEKGFDQLDRILSEIKSKGKEYIRLTPNVNNCPLCYAKYPPGKLIKLIRESRNNLKSTRVLEDIQKKVNIAENNLKLLLAKQQTIEIIKQIAFLLYGENGLKKSLANIGEAVAKNVNKSKKVEESYVRLKSLKEYFELKDLDEDSYNSLIEELNSLDVKLGNSKVFMNKYGEVVKEIKDLNKLSYTITSSLDKSNDQKKTKLNDIGIEKINQLEIRIENLIDAKESFNAILKLMQFDKNENISVIEKTIEKLIKLFEQYKILKKQKEEYEIRLKTSNEKIKRLQCQIVDNDLYRNRAKRAHDEIEGLFKNYNKADFLKDFINQNRDEITDIFSMIHSPKEFEGLIFEAGGNIALKRKFDDMPASLSEISTGQRSALALSVFSALNMKLKNGPNILMFDDPIANIDDLNILSYYDYLREVAVKGNRQIFFATANENAAFLFTQKFNFLGEDNFKIFELSGDWVRNLAL